MRNIVEKIHTLMTVAKKLAEHANVKTNQIDATSFRNIVELIHTYKQDAPKLADYAVGHHIHNTISLNYFRIEWIILEFI